ncbi:helicase with zinc finger domain 2-like isoform X1 [Epinephelus fuscoguttatus]|uniref:helicase with zinc finger domain 2-like isoform X1 n=2 Tax=Epinephelus fuscoguttatus TaxID=293821 RepID=UPI0020D09317|nr:helicase with zinc finger domain 2-like isoform X1 [Epinephelus fuscoguttatus]
MPGRESKLAPLLSTYDLKLACAQCSVKEKEITYTLKPVSHQCARNLLLCKAKGGGKWRPVSRRPTFPNPSQYVSCYFFVEGSGCTHHRNRCTFARSDEEAAVWTFEKHHRLDHVLLCNLIAQSEKGSDLPDNSEPLGDLLPTLDLKAVCDLCSIKEKEITYKVQSLSHKCSRNLLLAKDKASNQWRPVSDRPTGGFFGRNVFYQVCNYFIEGSGCTQHRQGCTYARSYEEATVWNYVRDKGISKDDLIRLVTRSEPNSLTPESAAKSILQQFSGEFIEFCKECYHDRPQKLTTKRWNSTCSGDAAHTWDPVLVHHLSENSRKHIYSQVRPLRPNCQFKYCSHVRDGKPCWHQAGHCQSAQSEVEMVVWKAENSGLSVRPHLLQLSRQEQTEPKQATIYCKVCLLNLSSPESFYKHCTSLEHAQLLSEDTTTKWRGRQPPHNHPSQFWLCDRPQTCEYGNKCPKAHSVEERQEWLMRAAEEKEIRHNIVAQGLMCYNERLLEEYKNSSNEVHIISEQVDDVSISCDEDLTVACEQINTTLKWNFQVETERQLVHVALLKQEPGASFSLGDISSLPCIYSSGEDFLTEDMTYDITVSFTSINPGLYDQWLVLDFDMRPVLLKKLKVRVGQQSLDDNEQTTVNHGATFQSSERWHRGNRVIIPCISRKEEQEELLKEYKPPQISFLYKSSHNSQTPLNNENYRERMHQFLYNEERAEDQIVSRLNVCGEITTMDKLNSPKFGLMIAPRGELFCAVSIPCNLTPDTPEGLVLKRSIHSGLIAPLSSSGQNSKVYEAIILPDKTSDNKIYLQLSEKCCSGLQLRSNESYQMEVQFQLNRHNFCSMHKAIDLLPDTKQVLPDLKKCGVPVNTIRYKKLNTKQQSAIDFITGNSTLQKCVAPLLIYGPFGTGKTFTLATAARELCKQPHNKVLICTHTNSSADLYVRDHLHPFINKKNDGSRPIRIKANKQGNALFATDEITLKYCLLSEDGQYFLPPTKAALDHHKIVITTTTMARNFHELKLPEGYFTHILIDEASQMLECEALMALALAGPNTRVVLAGDHMQMGPKLFSVDDHHRSNHTLLNRLFHYYQGQKCDAAQNSRIIFSENYRSTKEIVEFVSTHFYVGKNDVIQATGNIPAPANGRALKFHHVRGECLLDTVSMSWYNKEEVAKVVEEVKEILKHWPLTWGTKDQSSICVLSEGSQVRQIRAALSRKDLAGVHVENLANVQGKQFRAVIMTAVQTRDSLKTSHLPGLELFNDARVLNTAMTRAQSYVVVVGDAAALSCFGKCSAVWKSYIDHCISNNSVAPQHFTKDFFEKDVMETARFQKSEHVDESNTLSDAILQELKDEYEQKAEYSSDEDRLKVEDFDHHKSRSVYNISEADTDLLERCKKQPEMYSQGRFVRESYNRGYVIPFHNPARRINIKGRANLGKVFTGDEVVLQTAKVVSITKQAESARVLVCLLEDEDHSKPRQNSESKFVRRTMMPITKSAPKVCIHISKKRRNFLPIWEQINGHWTIAAYERLDENFKQNNAFVVQVIGWKEHCFIPLGNVIDILPIGSSLVDGLRLLNEEFKVSPNTCTYESVSYKDEDRAHRQDITDIMTFTVDPKGAEDLDDAISVRETGDQYELGVHIADVASFVSLGGPLDEAAKQLGATYYCSKQNPIHMFPQDLSTGHFSLLSGEVRRVVSLVFTVNKKTHEIIGKPKFQLSLIKSKRQLSYEEAEDMISERYRETPKFHSVEDCVAVAYCFAKAQRKIRLVDWAYSQPDDERLPGERKANLMIEELSVLFNTLASETLIGSEKTRRCTPLRRQAKPDPEKIDEFKENCGELIPLSFHVRHKVDVDEQAPNCENFRILTEVWEDIQSAARADDIDKMVDLIAADDIHPQLKPVVDQFRRCCSKAEIICSKFYTKAHDGHYSLNVRSYTQASSPIRRYMDLILQRLLHSIICDKDVQYTSSEIATLCSQFEEKLKGAKEYEQKAEQISYAVSMRKQSASKLAFVVSPKTDSFAVAFPFNKNMFAESVLIMYKDLQLFDQPIYDEANDCIILTWKRRIYAVDNMQIHQELKMPDFGPCVELPLAIWKATIEAIDKENWDHAKSLTMNADIKQLEKQNILPQSPEVSHSKTFEDEREQTEHEVDIELQLQRGDTLQIQMTTEVKRGYHMPAVQLVRIKPKFEICVHHVHSPITCFSRSADDPSRIFYSDTEEYKRIWKPLCEMESASTAVDESDSIVIENLVVNFKQEQAGILTGSFFLPLAWISRWAIECNLSKCLLCIRKRGLKLTSTPEHSALVDPREFTWVAHGVTRIVEEQKNPPNEGSKVQFYVNHLAMETIPDCVFEKNTCFTVEIIPKLLPDIRKENAVVSITSACDLVTSIALGKHILREVKSTWHSMRKELPNILPQFNLSQHLAVEKALNDTFTLIQGPPGTGKTVVGVYIVYCFFELNSKNQRKCVDPKDENKKQVILYCGPSNKSVDVVAEYLLRFGDRLRPLRVYSQQVEMLDYPYPDCTLQFSQRSLRQERAKPELRSITLHHRMRQDTNPFSGQIKDFDQRIKLAHERKGEELTAEEVKEYKILLRNARTHELERHDIILCTCTESSTPSLTKTVSARQILIDECAMATEPQALIPLVCNKPEKIVLIGDHKQLRPIVKNERVRKLGMAKSLFERYYTIHKNRAVMLDTQYRMHRDICEFPSKEYYEGKLKTGVEQPSSVLRVENKTMPIVFGDIRGKTISLVVSTAKGNENSKANQEERDKVIDIAEKLVQNAKIKQQSIAILSPYNAQVSEIRDKLKERNMGEITITTITKSQGSEWQYVIISTVCSLPSEEIEKEPDGAWLSKHVGFVGDPNQINVGITRAKEGLCIIGNQELLSCSRSWGKLLDHYKLHNAVTDADKISVYSAT